MTWWCLRRIDTLPLAFSWWWKQKTTLKKICVDFLFWKSWDAFTLFDKEFGTGFRSMTQNQRKILCFTVAQNGSSGNKGFLRRKYLFFQVKFWEEEWMFRGITCFDPWSFLGFWYLRANPFRKKTRSFTRTDVKPDGYDESDERCCLEKHHWSLVWGWSKEVSLSRKLVSKRLERKVMLGLEWFRSKWRTEERLEWGKQSSSVRLSCWAGLSFHVRTLSSLISWWNDDDDCNDGMHWYCCWVKNSTISIEKILTIARNFCTYASGLFIVCCIFQGVKQKILFGLVFFASSFRTSSRCTFRFDIPVE